MAQFGYDSKLLCRIQKGGLASGLVDLARLWVLHCHVVFPSSRRVLAAVWATIRHKASLSDPERTSSLRFGGSCTPFRPSLSWCFPIRQVPIQQVCFGCSLGYDTKLLCRIQNGRRASGLVDLARLSVLHCHGVFPSGRCVLAAVWVVIQSFSVGSRRDVTPPFGGSCTPFRPSLPWSLRGRV